MKPSEYIKKGWCQGQLAKDAYGIGTEPNYTSATRWCLYGAILAAYNEEILKRVDIIDKLYEKLPVDSMALWNDAPKRTREEVIKLLESVGE